MGDDILDRIGAGLEGIAQGITRQRAHRIWVSVPSARILDAVEFMQREFDTRYVISMPARDAGETFEIFYPFGLDNETVILKTSVPKDRPVIDSISGIIPIAEYYEREDYEMLGINFRGHPDLRLLFLPESWGDKGHPLRKDWDGPTFKGGDA